MKTFYYGLVLAITVPCFQAQGQLASPEITAVSPAEVSLTFTAPAGTPLGNFTLQSNPGLLEEDWAVESSASFSTSGGSIFSVTTPRFSGPNGEKRFYQILLDNEVIISFSTDNLAEGGSGGLPLNLSAPFSGSLPYTLLFSDGTSQEGSLNLSNATSATVPFSIFDDFTVSGERFVTLSVAPPGGSSFTQTFGIKDDDVLWDGVFTDEQGAELTFCMEELNQGSAVGLRLLNLDQSNFFPVGLGDVVVNPTFDDTTLSVTLTSASRLGDESAFGFPSFYELSLNGTVRAGSNALFYEGANLGDATLVHRVGRINPEGELPEDATDLAASNDTFATATDLGNLAPDSTLHLNGLSIVGNEDFFSFTSTAGTPVNIRIEFFDDDGDLDMETLDGAGARLNLSEGVSNTESFSFTSPGGTNTVRVYGFLTARNAYRLTIASQDLPPATTGTHLSTTTAGRFAVLQRPLQPADSKAALITPAN